MPTTTITPWQTTPTQMLDVGGTSFAHRELGPRGGTPLVLHHEQFVPAVLEFLQADDPVAP